MPRAFSVIAICLAAIGGAACAAGTPQDELEGSETSLALWPVVTTSEEARLQIADGVREYDYQRDDVAYEHFKRAIAADPASPSAYIWAARSAQSLSEAFAHVAKAKELAAGASEAEQLVISIIDQLSRNDAESAHASATRLVQVSADNPRSWLMLARVDSQLSKTADARASMQKAIEVAPEFTPAYIQLSQSYASNLPFDYAQAESLARKAMELSPDEPVVHNILGDALRAQGKLEEAAQSYTMEAELDAANGAGVQQRGHVNTFLGRYGEARADYEAAAALSEGNVQIGFRFHQAYVSLHEGKPAQAIAEIETVYAGIDAARAQAPQELKEAAAYYQFLIAFHHRMLPELEQAHQRLITHGTALVAQVATAEYQRETQAYQALYGGYVALAKGNVSAARGAAAEYIRIRQPDRSPNKDVPAHALLGHVALDEKKYDEAVREFEQTDVDNMFTTYYHGLALEGAGRTADAQQVFARIAAFYFNPIDLAVIRHDALAKVRKQAS